MAAILRSGKFLRLVSSAARNLVAGQGQSDDGGALSHPGLAFDNGFNQANFSIQNVLPYIGVSDSGHAEDRFPTRLALDDNLGYGSVNKEEIELMIVEIEATEADKKSGTMQLISSQALLAMRLCGSILDKEIPSTRNCLVSKIWSLMKSKGISLSVLHYNALLRVHLENSHAFNPEEVLQDMQNQGIAPDKDTFQCLISRHCQQGDIEGASKMLQMMKSRGFKVNENIFNSLILGHGEAGDMARSHGMLKVMRQWGLTPSQETYLTLACAYVKHGDWMNVEKVMSEAGAQGVDFTDGDFLELIYAMSEAGHKEHIGKVLSLTKPEMPQFSRMASHLVVRLVNSGHDDVAYNVVKYTVDQSCEEGGREVCLAFLDQIVRLERPVAKLLWIVRDLAENKQFASGLDQLVKFSMSQKNFSLSVKLINVLLNEGGKIEEKSYKDLLKQAVKTRCDDNVVEVARIGKKVGLLTQDILKQQIFSNMDNWPELIVTSLEEAGISRAETVTPMVEWLVGEGKTEAAQTLAGIFPEHVDDKLKFLTSTNKVINNVCNHFVETETANERLPPKNVPDSTIHLSQTELESLLSDSNTTADIRGKAYMSLLEIFINKGDNEQALKLSQHLKREENLHLPEFESKFNSFMEPNIPPYIVYPYPYIQYSNQLVPVMYHCYPVPASPHQTYPSPSYAPVPTYPPYDFSETHELSQSSTPRPNSRVSNSLHEPTSGHLLPTALLQQGGNNQDGYISDASSIVNSGTSITSPQNPYLESPPLIPGQSIFDGNYYNFQTTTLHRQLKKAINGSKPRDGYLAYRALEEHGRNLNVTETSALLEQLIKANMMKEAGEITLEMLSRDTYPLPKIFRFMLNKLASNGSVEEMKNIEQFLSSKIKKEVSFDNRLCNAFLAAGRGSEFLEILARNLEAAINSGDTNNIETVKEQFPRGGALGILDTNPELLDRFTHLATKFASIGYSAPMNILWTYHFIHGNKDVANTIWQSHVKSSSQIMFQKVCQVARTTGNIDLAFNLVRHLEEAENVTSGAKGIAYSCLLDCLCMSNNFFGGYSILKDAVDKKVNLEDMNRTALVRLKEGLEGEGHTFPYNIPPKTKKKDGERSLSPVDWNEL